jgi:tRNA threonylcarbamoyladenosine biosynthesis protein TsaB
MKILGIDSATPSASIAVVIDGHVADERVSDAHGHRADLLVIIDAACKAAGVTPLELDAVAIGAGPGSFTGLRIGMATAKGIAFAAGKPLWAVSSLAALASMVDADRVCAVLDARRGEIYAGVYRRGGVLDGIERVMPPSELAAFARDATTIGDIDGLDHRATPSGSSVAKLALAGARVDVLALGVPTYIRASEAEIRYPDGVPGALRKR